VQHLVNTLVDDRLKLPVHEFENRVRIAFNNQFKAAGYQHIHSALGIKGWVVEIHQRP
jgi:hypothetical protein